ncbi:MULTISPECIES: hypothetical protein [unclassified Sphingopyxis]|uniref:hypothetical protein n=1 Tax=unclassified Sphingopyxis TaxID=2614943 RepID=UPI0028550043|nr:MULTISPECIES: hypothetical protein [unclassified Sphingopyxis]MDR6831851.1 hypothetical protein [Sphingopyxis sp. BE122]MDR7227593.1 hypothetical protein [Sphingopyxis sp. BE259]
MSRTDPDQFSLLEALMHEAWGDVVPAEEWAIARSMAPDRLHIALQRLDAVMDEERRLPLSDAAIKAGMDRIAFFRLRQRWKRDRSLRSLTPFIGRAPRRVGLGKEGASELALKLVKDAGKNADTSILVEQLIAQSADAISRQTATRLLRDASARASADPEVIEQELGSEILVDFSGTAMRTAIDEGGHIVAVCLAVESASRIILGWAAGPISRSGTMLLETLFNSAADYDDVGDAGQIPGRLRIVTPEGFGNFAGLLISPQSSIEIVNSGERRFGRQLIKLLGHRIGRVSLHPRAYARGEPPANGMSAARIVSLKDATALIGEAVRHHNADRRNVLIDAVTKVTGSQVTNSEVSEETGDALALKTILKAVDRWRDGRDRLASTVSLGRECASALALLLPPMVDPER